MSIAPSSVVADDRLARRNAFVLALAQALAGANVTIIISTVSIIGAILAPHKGLATLPVTALALGMWLGTLPLGALARHWGRRRALQIGSLFGVVSGLISYFAVIEGSFAFLLLGGFFSGIYAAAHQSYRFAAADTASERFRPKAIAWVLAGGILAAVLGPQLVIYTKDLLSPHLFAATYLGQAACALLATLVLQFVNISRPPIKESDGARPLSAIIRSPRFIVAAACGMASYGLMNMVMTSAPLAMVGCGHSIDDATLAIQWHVLAMYAPSFFTGHLITRYRVERMTALGFALLILAAVTGMAGTSIAHFWTALVLLGFGWNFSFIGATTMVTECHTAHERNKVQAFNDFLVFGTMAVSSFLSGQLLEGLGWMAINLVVFPAVLVALGLLAWRGGRTKPHPVSA